MGRIDDIFAARSAEGRPLLMPFITAGHPSLAVTEAVLPRLEAAGADIVELGVPFSDPIADGPVIAAAMHEALEAGVRPGDVLELVARVRGQVSMGLVAMVSCSIVERMGGTAFIHAAADAGIDGFIVPDVDPSVAEGHVAACDERDLAYAMLVAPTTPPDRVARLVGLCRGFVYLLARTGITGERDAPPEIGPRLADIRSLSDLPVAAGFGISRPEHVAAVTGGSAAADAAIVGSALVRRMAEAADPVTEAERFVAELAGALPARG
jgi:tryptophan synthase alpha chain